MGDIPRIFFSKGPTILVYYIEGAAVRYGG